MLQQKRLQKKIQQNQLLQYSNSQHTNTIFYETPNFRCSSGYFAQFICISEECKFHGFICQEKQVNGEKKCSCLQLHYKCQFILVSKLLNSMKKRQEHYQNTLTSQHKQKIEKSYNQLSEQINIMIDDLSLLKIRFENQKKYSGLSSQQLKFIYFIDEERFEQINGRMISKLIKSQGFQRVFSIKSAKNIKKRFELQMPSFDKMLKNIHDSIGRKQYLKQINSQILKTVQQRQILNKIFKQLQIKNQNQIIQYQKFQGTEQALKRRNNMFMDQFCDEIYLYKLQNKRILGFYKSANITHTKSFIFGISIDQPFLSLNQEDKKSFQVNRKKYNKDQKLIVQYEILQEGEMPVIIFDNNILKILKYMKPQPEKMFTHNLILRNFVDNFVYLHIQNFQCIWHSIYQ